jgi:arylsulfatase A-like enzyme
MGRYDDVEIPEPNTLFDDHSTRHESLGRVWMGVANMKGPILNIGPTAKEIAADPSKMPKALVRMTDAQRAVWHKFYDPRNEEFRRLEAAGLLTGQARTRYIYQRLIKDYLRCVDALDENIGRILAALEKRGLAKNTLVVYSSDQGFLLGEHGWTDKRWIFEESLSSPLIMRWPGVVKPGRKIDALVQNIDLAPTFLDVAGARTDEKLDGLSLVPLLKGKKPAGWRRDILYRYYDGGVPGNPGAYNMPRHEGVRDNRYKLVHYVDYDAWELYDLKLDPRELVNRAKDPEYAAELSRMKIRLQALLHQFDAPQMPPLRERKKRRRRNR